MADRRRRHTGSLHFGVDAVRTRQNKPWRVGRYRLDLTRGLDTRSLADGAYRVDVETTDTAGNRSRNATTVVVRTAAPVPVAKTGR